MQMHKHVCERTRAARRFELASEQILVNFAIPTGPETIRTSMKMGGIPGRAARVRRAKPAGGGGGGAGPAGGPAGG